METPLDSDTVDYDINTFRNADLDYDPHIDQTDILHPRTRIFLEWKDIKLIISETKTYQFGLKRKKPKVLDTTILNKVSGSVGPGSIFAIMGATGSGKTSLLKTLAGVEEEGNIYGKVLVNGAERSSQWRYVIGYVDSQTKYLDSRQTVREAMEFVADLYMPKDYAKSDKIKRINKLLKSLGLFGIAESHIGSLDSQDEGISGGERKRLALALELLREPKVLFLDEPTSGLDANSAKCLIEFLDRLAKTDSLTIIITVQAPRMRILQKFEKILLLAAGSMIFCGNIHEALEYFAKTGMECGEGENPAECFIDISTFKRPNSKFSSIQELEESWKKELQEKIGNSHNQHEPHESIKPETIVGKGYAKKDYPHDRWTEMKIILHRQHKVSMRDGNYIILNTMVALFVGLYSGFVWFQMSLTDFSGVQDRIGLIYFTPRTIMNTILAAVLVSRAQVRHERLSSLYRASSSFLATCIFFIPSIFLISLVHLLLTYYLSGLRYVPFTAMLIFVGFNYLHSIAYLALGFIGGSLTDSFETGMVLATITISLVRLFSGAIVNLRNMTPILSWLRFLSPAYYVLQGLGQNEFNGRILNGQPGEFWLAEYALDLTSTIWCAGALIIYCVITTGIAYFAYNWTTRPVFRVKTISH